MTNDKQEQKGNNKTIKYAINVFVIVAICWMCLFNFLGMSIGGNFYLTMPEPRASILEGIVLFSMIFTPVYAILRFAPWYKYKRRAAQVLTAITIAFSIPAGFLAGYTTGWIALAFIMPVLFTAALIYDELAREHGKY